MKQQNWIKNTKGGTIHIHNAPEYHSEETPTKAKDTDPYPVTINTRDADLKGWLYETAEKIRNEEEVDPKYGGSTLGAEAISMMRELIRDGCFDRRHKFLRHVPAIRALLDNLP